MSEIVFFLEELSAEALLKGLLPRILPNAPPCKYVVHEGKQDLEKRLEQRLRGYRVPGARFVVLRDQDSADCRAVKNSLRNKCAAGAHPDVLVRIACREIESWYLADLRAVERGLGVKGLASRQQEKRFRDPDSLPSPAKELSKIAPSYQKIGGSRLIGPHLDVRNTRSTSFRHFVNGIRGLAAVARGT
ncbi:MAG: DUF4276 family protein [Elusimicrobia bacterium]|nr:DUF4276 family protein [Elusimicrobiota bacterium]